MYRNNALYHTFMPGLWLSGVLVYLGFGWVYVGYSVVKIAVTIGAHSSWRRDEALYRIPAMHPVMWVLERTISTPATHHAPLSAGLGRALGDADVLPLPAFAAARHGAVLAARQPAARGLRPGDGAAQAASSTVTSPSGPMSDTSGPRCALGQSAAPSV